MRKLGTRLTLALVVGAVLAWWASPICPSAYLFHGLAVATCPDGRPALEVQVYGHDLRRGGEGLVGVHASGVFATSAFDTVGTRAPVHRVRARYMLVDPDGAVLPLSPAGSQSDVPDDAARVAVPTGRDGDYTLRAQVTTPLGEQTAEVKVPLYAPAQLVLVLDRPLVKPGEVVRARVLGLRARDLAPLAGRKGQFELVDPSGEVLAESSAALSSAGVAWARLPLEKGATPGRWAVRFRSGDASVDTPLEVARFELPRMALEAQARPAVLAVGDRPEVEIVARYASGAPVPGAELTLDFSVSGPWPPPPEWLVPVTPRPWRTGPDGRFLLRLGPVPDDLVGANTLTVGAQATEPGGQSATADARFVLARDAIAVEAVTELEGGLVEGFPNRLYLRVTSADGEALRDAALEVQPAWAPRAKPFLASTDEDGVAELVLDPGPPVNVVIPPLPVRLPPPPPPVALSGAEALSTGSEPSLDAQLDLEALLVALAPCARFATTGPESLTIGLAATADGRYRVVPPAGPEHPIEQCLARAADPFRGKARRAELFRVNLELRPPRGPYPEVSVDLVSDEGLDQQAIADAIAERLLDRRACLPTRLEDATPLPFALTFSLAEGGKTVRIDDLRVPTKAEGDELDEGSRTLDARSAECLVAGFREAHVFQKAEHAAAGLAHVTIQPGPEAERATRATPTTLLGYELRVRAKRGDALVGDTQLRLSPGTVPGLRIRLTPTLAHAGEAVDAEVLRGPGYRGTLPKTLWLEGPGLRVEAPLDAARKARFTLPAGAAGFYQVQLGDARGLVFVAQDRRLEVTLTSDKPRYRPGEPAHLRLQTRVDERGAAATVGLFGVDASLGQLTALPTPAVLSKLEPSVAMSSPTFAGASGQAALDGQALVSGRVRGQAAARAILLRVASVPAVPELDTPGSGSAQTTVDTQAVLVEHFYGVVAQLQLEVARWDREAPPDRRLDPKTQVELWRKALAEARKQGLPVDDAFGRPLRLSALPPDLLALVSPLAVGLPGERIPEDLEDWSSFVAREAP